MPRLKTCKLCTGTGKMIPVRGSVMFECYILVHKDHVVYGVWDSKEGVQANLDATHLDKDDFDVIKTTFVQKRICYCKQRKK